MGFCFFRGSQVCSFNNDPDNNDNNSSYNDNDNPNGGNVVMAINEWSVSLLRYSICMVDWTKAELRKMDRKTRKIVYYLRGPVTESQRGWTIYLPRRLGGPGPD